ncbi:winged helix-turn-helix transcriptional regulator [Nakamurella lactea]|uniref:winged helix-turn-helix transcriptional regulator n=1 Tax=Nakamurella lactea TaxID=459515 RepID=UPI000412D95A|nr:helix-turn-helix domain-containing protein [Nakamurella lactea]
MKSYQQYCSVARALDVVGDRWVLLIVRELLALGPSRYSDLKRGLPGIASNLLAERLRSMQADGLIDSFEAPAPVGTSLYQLTANGRDLEAVVRALSRWGLGTMPSGPSERDAVQPQWSALFAGLNLSGNLPAGGELVVAIDSGGGSVRVLLRSDGFRIDRAVADGADVMLRGDARLIGAVLSGGLTPTEATDLGLTITGRADQLADLVSNSSPRMD